MDHAGTIGDPELRRLYRDQWLGQFDGEVAPRRDQRQSGFQRGKFVKGKGFVPPPQPMSAAARAIGSGGIDRATARALVVGFANFPQALAAHIEQLSALPIADAQLARLRDRLVDAVVSGEMLDRDALATILASAGASADLNQARQAGGIAFSFTRSDSDPERAVRDLEVAIDALAADNEIGTALAAATERLQAGEDDAFEEQQRLLTVRNEIKERLASLAGTD
jgi:DNA primase